MGKSLHDDLDFYLDDEKPAKNYVKVNDCPGNVVYKKCLRDGLTALTDFYLSDDEKIIEAYNSMRTPEEIDFKNGNPVMKQFTDDEELIRIFYKDMCDALHGKNSISFRTKMTLEGAKYVLIALSRKILGKKAVKSVMEEVGVSFDEYGKHSALEKFIDTCDRQEKSIIKLRKKERERLKSLQKTYGSKVGLKKYLKLRDED